MNLKGILSGILLFSVASTTAASTAAGSHVRVIANSSVKASQISSNELRSVFLGTKTSLADGTRVEPVLLKAGGAHDPSIDAFIETYTGKSVFGLENYYRSLVFAGKGMMPRIFASEVEVLAYVRKTKGAIGYVNADGDAAGVKWLEVK